MATTIGSDTGVDSECARRYTDGPRDTAEKPMPHRKQETKSRAAAELRRCDRCPSTLGGFLQGVLRQE